MTIALFSALLMLASSPAAAKTPAPAPDPQKKVCVSETPTGSNLPRRVCHTVAEWAAIRQAERAQADRIGQDIGGRTDAVR